MQTTISFDRLLERSTRPASTRPRPFLRWAGSKRSHLWQIVDLLPERFGRYYEPFLGSGALFFLLQPPRAQLGDLCPDLVDAYQAIRDDCEAVVRHLRTMSPSKEVYYETRSRRSRGRFKRAADFVYLNKTCWNGLYRVNSDGRFNVPYGRPKKNQTEDLENLRQCSMAMARRGVRVAAQDFEETLANVRKGDLVFLDPPYVTRHNNNGFVEYNESLFSWDDQRRLAATARRLKAIGAHVVVTNAAHAEIEELYHGFYMTPFSRKSTLAGDVSKRGEVREMVFSSS